ncbi:MAG TPA: tetratricopeptide repeat protein, partial [Blastocatellia bacterium]|nr:tetratricopeptide repeat protein [Blastocatellia bacterium]
MNVKRGRLARLAAAAAGLLICGLLTWQTGQTAISRLLSIYGESSGELAAAEAAVKLNPADPIAHLARATVLSDADEWAAAVSAYEFAASLRPIDFTLWLALGQAREQAGKPEDAIEATRRAVRFAPYYAQPRWQLGNLLLRAGQYEEAFLELRRAVASNPALLQPTIDLAYGLYGGDEPAIIQALQPQTPAARITVARAFARHGRTDAAVRMFRAVGEISDRDRSLLLAELLAAEQFPEAYEVWLSGRRSDPPRRAEQGAPTVTNGDFESEVFLDDPGFEWQILRNVRAVKTSFDARQPHAGAHSLRLDWNGDAQTSLPVATQRVLVKPEAHYRLSFWARHQNLVTGGLP